MQVNAETLAKLTRRCSGQAMKIAIDGATPQDISTVLTGQGVIHRVIDAQDPTVFDDKGPTIVTGMENLSQTAMACLVSQMDGLRFREVLIFPTKKWFEAEECELTYWDRMDPTMREKFRNRVTVIDIEGF